MLYPDLCPAGYSLILTGQVNFSVNELECRCDQNNTFVIHCENDQDEIIIRVRVKLNYRDLCPLLKENLCRVQGILQKYLLV